MYIISWRDVNKSKKLPLKTAKTANLKTNIA